MPNSATELTHPLMSRHAVLAASPLATCGTPKAQQTLTATVTVGVIWRAERIFRQLASVS